MKLYKLTDENDQTRSNTQWGENVTHEASGEGELCGPGWLHAYTHPLLAIFFNPTHAMFKNPHLWTAEGEIEKEDDRKVGCKKLTTIEQIPLPTITTEQRITIAILAVKTICADEMWNDWADNWLNGKNRSTDAAKYCAWVTSRSVSQLARAAEYAATSEVVWFAAHVAQEVALICSAARAEEIASYAAANAVSWIAASEIDLVGIIEKVCNEGQS